MIDSRKMGQAFNTLLLKVNERTLEPAVLGIAHTSSVDYAVPGRPGYLYVSLGVRGDLGTGIAYDAIGVQHVQQLVKLRREFGEYVIQQADLLVMGGAGGGSEFLADLNDVALTTLSNGQALIYSAATNRWTNTSLGEGPDPYLAGDGIEIAGLYIKTKHMDAGGIWADTNGLYVNRATVSGLTIATGAHGGGLAVGQGTGISVSASAVSVNINEIIDTSRGIENRSGLIAINLSNAPTYPPGLAFAPVPDGGLMVKAGNGLTVDPNGVRVLLGPTPGLEFDSVTIPGGLMVKEYHGIAVDDLGVRVKVKTTGVFPSGGLAVDSSGLFIDLAADSGLEVLATTPLVDGGLRIGLPADLTYDSASGVTGSNHSHNIVSSADVASDFAPFTTGLLHASGGGLTLRTLTLYGNQNFANPDPLQSGITAVQDLTLAPMRDLALRPVGDVKIDNTAEFRSDAIADQVTGIQGIRLFEREDILEGGADEGGGFNYWQMTIGAIKADEIYARAFVADEVRLQRAETYLSRSFGIVETKFDLPNIGETVDVWFEDSTAIDGKLFLVGNYLQLRVIDLEKQQLAMKCWFEVMDGGLGPVIGWVEHQPQTEVTINGVPTTKIGRQKWRLKRTIYGTTGAEVKKGTVILDSGTPGWGWVHSSAISGVGGGEGPFVQVGKFDRVQSGEPIHITRTRMGRLSGVIDYPASKDDWGFATGNDLSLAPNHPDTPFKGMTSDSNNGLRLFNTDVYIYDSSLLATSLTNEYGLAMRVDTSVAGSPFIPTQYMAWYVDLGNPLNRDALGNPAPIPPSNKIMSLGVRGTGSRFAELLVATNNPAYASTLLLKAEQYPGFAQSSIAVHSGIFNADTITYTEATRIVLDTQNTIVTGRLSAGRSISGLPNVGYFYEDSTAVNQTAGVVIEQDGTGDADFHWLVSPSNYWTAGIDNDGATYPWKLSKGHTLGLDDYIIANSIPTRAVVLNAPATVNGQLTVNGGLTFTGDLGIGTNTPGIDLAGSTFDYLDADTVLHVDGTNSRLIAQGSSSASLDLIDETYIHLGISSAERWFQVKKDGQFTRVSALNANGATKLDFFMLDHASGYVGMGSQGVGMGGTGSDHVLTATLDLINRPSAATHILATTYADYAAADESTYDLKATTYKQGVTGVPFAGGAGGVYHFVAQFARGTLQIPNNPITGDNIMRIAAVGYAGGWSGPDAGTILLTAQENFTRVGSVYNAGAEWRFITRGKGVQGERTRLVLGSEGVTIGLHDNADSVMRWTITTGETVTAGLDFTDKWWKVSKDGDLGAPGKDIIIHNLADGKTYIPGLVLPEHTHPHTHPPLLRGAGDSVETFAVEPHDPATGAVGGGIVVTTPQILSVDSSVVRISRSISVGDGLDGGGDFSQNRGIGLIVKTNGGIILEPNPNGLSIGLASPSGLTLIGGGLAILDSLAGSGLLMNPATKVMSLDMGAVVPATRTISAGAGLMGGGNLTQDRSFDVGAGDGIIVDVSSIRVNRASVPYAFTTFTAGAGMTGGGDLTTGGTFNIGAGAGIIVSEDSIAVDLSLFPVKTTQIIAGNGLSGGGTLAAPVTLHVNSGDGIQLVSDTVAVDSSVVRTSRTITTTPALTGGGSLASNLVLGLQLAATSGLSQTAGLKIGAGPFSGITVNANDIALDLAAVSGLQVVTDGLRINLALISGLEIDPTYGFRIKLPVASGLVLNGGLSLDPALAGDGLSIDANKVMSVGQGAGILVGENDISLDLAVVSGLEVVPGDGLRVAVMADAGLALYTLGLGLDFASEPGLQLIPGDGLAIQLQTDSGLEVDHGLALSQAIAGNGLDMGSDKVLHVQPGPGINVTADMISIDLGADYHWQGSHTWSTGTVTFNTDPQINANLDFIGGERNITTESGNLNLVPFADLVLNPGGKDVLPGGSNLIDFGDYNRKWRTLFASELYVETLVAQDVMASIGGRVIVSNTTSLMAAVNTTQTTIDVKHNNLPLNGYVVLQTAPGGIMQFEVLKVTSGPTALGTDLGYRYTVVRNLDGVSADDPVGANAWLAGDAVMSLGADVGDGYIDLSAVKTVLNHVGPTMTIYSRTGTAAWNDIKPVTTMGNLSSFAGIGTDVFGFAAANDLLLTPSTGLSGVVVKGQEGMSLYNTDIDMYEAGNLHLRIDNESGIALKLWDDGETSLYRVGWFPSVASPSYSGSYAFTMAYNSSGRVIHSTSVKSAFHQADIDLEAQSTSPNQYSRLIVSSAGSSWATNATRFMQDIAGNTFIGNFSDIGFQSVLTIGEYTSGAAPAAEGLTIQQQSAGDATLHFFHYLANQRWTMGIDRSDDASFKIGQVAGFGSNVALTINPSNNIGIGVVAINDWNSSFTALQFGGSSALMAGKGTEGLYLMDGAYYSDTWRRKNATVAPTQLSMNGGQFYFSVAPTGSADGAITWTTALRIDNSANLLASRNVFVGPPTTGFNEGYTLQFRNNPTIFLNSGGPYTIGRVSAYVPQAWNATFSGPNATEAVDLLFQYTPHSDGRTRNSAAIFMIQDDYSGAKTQRFQIDQLGVHVNLGSIRFAWADGQRIVLPFQNGATYEQAIAFEATNRIMRFSNKSADGSPHFIFDWPGTAQGNVGIGTATPAQKLDVEGNIRAKGSNLYLGTGGTLLGIDGSNTLYHVSATNAQYFLVNTSTYMMTLATTGLGINTGSSGPAYGVLDVQAAGAARGILVRGGGGGVDNTVMRFSYDTTHQYKHHITAAMDGGTAPGNTLKFWLWSPADGVGADGTKMVLNLRGDGLVQIPSVATYAVNGTAVHVDGSGFLSKATSSIRFKQNVRPLPDGFDDDFVMRLKPIMYNNKFGDDKNDYVGFVAEDVWDIGGAPFISHNAAGQVESLHYDKLTVPIVAAIQGLIPLKERVAELEQRIRELEAKL